MGSPLGSRLRGSDDTAMSSGETYAYLRNEVLASRRSELGYVVGRPNHFRFQQLNSQFQAT